MSKNPEILDRLTAVEQRLTQIEAQLAELTDSTRLRDELRQARERADALARQGLHVVDLLARARKELHDLRAGGGA